MAGTRSNTTLLAKRYAQAFFSLAKDRQALETVERDMAALQKSLETDSSFRAILGWPHLTKSQRQQTVQEIVRHFQLSQLTAQFLGVLTQNRRLEALNFTIQAFQDLIAEHRGERTAKVGVARPLSPEQKENLEKTLSQMTGAKINVETTVDPALMGGVVIQLGSYLMDASLKTQLERLGHAVKGTA